MGYTPEELVEANRLGIEFTENLRARFENSSSPMLIAGCIGPRGDAFFPKEQMTAEEAARYHKEQIETFSRTPRMRRIQSPPAGQHILEMGGVGAIDHVVGGAVLGCLIHFLNGFLQ